MRRILLEVAYDGTDYCGWQVQPNGVTIEEKLNDALSQLLGEEIRVIGASRTDAGVHSRGSICVFDTQSRFPADKVSFAVNQRLPEDIVVQRSCEVPEDWHPRYEKSTKTYEYKILNRTFAMPTIRRDTYFFHRPLDVARMQEAAAVLVGEHDFESFASIHRTVDTTVRTLYECSVTRDDEDVIRIRVTGNGFLYNMVRIIAGTLIQIGAGELPSARGTGETPAESMTRILQAKNREAAGPTAPAHGLTMICTKFEKEPKITEKVLDIGKRVIL